MPSCVPQTVRRDVVRRFVAAATSSSDRIGLRLTVGGGRETSGRRRGRAGTATAAPGPRPTVLRPTPNTLSVEELVSPTPLSTFPVHHWGQWDFEFFGRKILAVSPIGLNFGTLIGGTKAHPLNFF